MGDAAVPPDNGAPKITGGDGQGTIRSFSNMLNQKYATKRKIGRAHV